MTQLASFTYESRSEARLDPTAAPPGELANRCVVLARLGGRGLSAEVAALVRGGASVRLVDSMAGARRAAALLGPRTAVIIDAPADPGSLCGGLRALSRQDAVLLLSDNAGPAERISLVHSGADRVIRRADPQEVVAELRAVLRRLAHIDLTGPPESVSCGPIRVDLAHRTIASAGRALSLTSLEFDLLAYFTRYAGLALSRERLLADVWGYDVGGLSTVTVHLRRLRRKIEVDPSRPVLLQTVWGVGYRMTADHGLPPSAPTPLGPW